ncbi:MAG: NAD(P)-dependent glycerol-3-phosphate dehydrogenase [Nitrospirae bacterium]|nr:MAG: glycerol-3-phosphate dehydrogenase [Nitrospirae bacterium 13_2_20CM_2_62_8]OLC61330.1 MAG: glycerol-3-phosphate dehydrogenase [Candidatus Rokubacteria bacterium 13_1_40CM_4_67_11]OLC80171.1 MAG: glycerol-3-phosphate dehydrogenase [Nitrospirae bacterium 13_1_40CM_3_62_11]TLY42609.1 MAG: NAD(P)-dependent glycerol-3-phosphate dehydrogenase [Nitrospirota bacterium]
MADAVRTFQRVAVIGAGAWGTTLARLLADTGLHVRLWAYEREVVEAIRHKHENTLFLPGVRLPTSLSPTISLGEALQDRELLVFAVPSHAARAVLRQIGPLLSGPIPLVSATKGIEEGTFQLMSQVIQETLPPGMHRSLAFLSGPSFAAEVCRGQPTAVVLAGEDVELVRRLQALLMTPFFRVYAGTDLIGVQLGGALKNVMALAAGVVDGLGLGHNTRAALITRGLAEMVRLGTAMGADPRTFYGLSGVGDLVLTCTGALSRNYTVGLRLGKGHQLQEILKETHAVAEGVRTSRAALGLADRFGVEMPIVREVCAVLFEGKSPQQVVADLMVRAAKDETVS